MYNEKFFQTSYLSALISKKSFIECLYGEYIEKNVKVLFYFNVPKNDLGSTLGLILAEKILNLV